MKTSHPTPAVKGPSTKNIKFNRLCPLNKPPLPPPSVFPTEVDGGSPSTSQKFAHFLPPPPGKILTSRHSPHQILPKASSSDCIPVVVLKNCDPELSYILAEIFNKCHNKSCFPDCWKVSSVFPVFKNIGERSTAKN